MRRWPLTTFFLLAFAFTWALLPLARASVAIAVVSLLGPAVAAFITAALLGADARRDLWSRVLRWRVPVRWYVVALLLPVLVTVLRTGIEELLGTGGTVRVQALTPLALVVFVMVAGEEIGWRGFALPRLLERFGPWRASATLGVLWALWHLPLFYMRGMPQYGSPFGAYVLYLVALSLVMTFLLQRADGSIVIATLFHGAVNTFGFVNDGAGALVRGWSNGISYAVAALVMRLVLRRDRVAVPGNGNLARVDRVR